MQVRNLIIEVTRRCNMKCAHCLRGEAQNCDISLKTIDRIFEDITSVDCIIFTGGEPFMNTGAIAYALYVCVTRNIPVYGFYLVTNGKDVEDAYIQVADDWMSYIMSCNYNLEEDVKCNALYSCDIFEGSGIAVSLDEYHESIPLKNYLRYRMLAYYTTEKEHNQTFSVRLEGRAEENNLDGYKPIINGFYIDFLEEEQGFESDNIIVETIYVSSIGEVVSDCDLSYEHIAELSIGNIKEESLFNILKNNLDVEEDYDKKVS